MRGTFTPAVRVLVCAAAIACAGAAGAQSVVVSGVMGNKALLVVDGQEPKLLGPGSSHRGVTVLALQGNEVVLEIAGQRQTMRVGGTPVSVGQQALPGAGLRIVLTADSGGHFVSQGHVNSRPVQFMIDTGATTIGISVSEADRIGLKYKQGQAVQVATANGHVPGWKVQVASVRINDVEVRNIDAVVTPVSMPFVLLGNSYLTRFQMTRNNEQMVLEKRF